MKGAAGSSPSCDRPGCDRRAEARGLCRTHYERERGRHRHRPDRMLANRARSRALSQLAEIHRGEFRALYDQALTQVREEAERHRDAIADLAAEGKPTDNVVRLRPGPRPTDEDTEDRIAVTQQTRCTACQTYHDAGHKCPACAVMARGADPLKVRVPAQPPVPDRDTRIRELIEAGRPAQWIVDQGFSRADVGAVLREINRQRERAAQ